MDVLSLSRLQFAVTCMFHFIFVPLTLGISILVAWMETHYVRTGDGQYKRMAKFWGKLFLINFALGVVTGITMEFQFGMNWAEYSKYVGDIFGAPLAIEATVAFFLESVFIGVWIFGWDKVSKKVHLMSIWIVAIATNVSGLVIILANGWMQHPVGYVLRNGRAEMVDFPAVLTNTYGLLKFAHQITSAYTVGAFFVMGVSAYHLLHKHDNPKFFRSSFRIAATFGLVATLLVAFVGDQSALEVVKTQPAKFAAMESVWETQKGAPIHLFMLPDEEGGHNHYETIAIPHMLSFLATHEFDGEVRGLKSIPRDERPPVMPVFVSFRTMAGIGSYLILMALIGFVLSRKTGVLEKYPFFLKVMVFTIPVPYIANQLGWIVAEMGRQPWIVYGVLKTADGVSKAISTTQVLGSLVGFTLLYGFLGVIDIYLLAKYARLGPVDDQGTH
ncbi:MAG TPA: cytochrome ubiquinol oxidase subunit I [Candidatus Deferrimicrobiaceae bacterium]|jgi:cytochrome d ubiquinol oxidase subunit I